jgi:hypothetical protein
MPKKKATIRRGKRGKKPAKKALPLKFGPLVGKGKGLLSELLAETPPKAVKPVKGPEPIPKIVQPPTAAREIKPPEIGKVLDSYGQVEILSVKSGVLPFYRVKMPELTKEDENR